MGIAVEFIPAGTAIAGNHVSASDGGVYEVGAPDCCRLGHNILQHSISRAVMKNNRT